MISASEITKWYGNLQVLKGIDVNIENSKVISIVGASGAGKTTLLQILGTLGKPNTGRVIINDVEVSKLKERDLARFRNLHIGFVFQFHHLLPEFTALENVCIPAFIQNVSRRKAEERATELLEFLGLRDRMQHKPEELSGGEQQRVAVARALINNPSVVFADEPSGNLDSQNKQELHRLFFQLRDKFRQTFVIVTHDMSLADMSDRKIVMADGRIISGHE
ncbi:MAG TPA: ABC transporter ATP-binding protein [Bacteroidales bacterium]|nr:ABC transporter ATP-binding protein [Bacteroidales bacterium]